MAEKIVKSLLKRPSKPKEVSRTKAGAVLVGISLITGGIGKFLLGEMDIIQSLQAIALGVGEILVVVGIRDLLP